MGNQKKVRSSSFTESAVRPNAFVPHLSEIKLRSPPPRKHHHFLRHFRRNKRIPIPIPTNPRIKPHGHHIRRQRFRPTPRQGVIQKAHKIWHRMEQDAFNYFESRASFVFGFRFDATDGGGAPDPENLPYDTFSDSFQFVRSKDRGIALGKQFGDPVVFPEERLAGRLSRVRGDGQIHHLFHKRIANVGGFQTRRKELGKGVVHGLFEKEGRFAAAVGSPAADAVLPFGEFA